jgi:hypothetical protein
MLLATGMIPRTKPGIYASVRAQIGCVLGALAAMRISADPDGHVRAWPGIVRSHTVL